MYSSHLSFNTLNGSFSLTLFVEQISHRFYWIINFFFLFSSKSNRSSMINKQHSLKFLWRSLRLLISKQTRSIFDFYWLIFQWIWWISLLFWTPWDFNRKKRKEKLKLNSIISSKENICQASKIVYESKVFLLFVNFTCYRVLSSMVLY